MVLRYTVRILSYISFLVIAVEHLDAEPVCKWSEKETANCSGLGLVDVPDNIPSGTKILDLSENEIKKIKSKAFVALVNLRKLYLQNNKLEALDINAFAGLHKLFELDLSYNKLVYSNETFDAGLFSPLETLFKLTLHGNLITNYSTYPDLAIGKCKKLITLKLDGIYAESLGYGFKDLNHLLSLTFSCDRYPNTIGILFNDTFSYVSHLERLTLSGCNIGIAYSGAFCPLENLLRLDISNNVGLKMMRNISYGLQKTNIKFLNASRMTLPHSVSIYIRKLDIEFLRNTSIEEIDASGNNIEIVDAEAIAYLPDTLEVLDVSDNRFVFSEYVYKLHKMKNIRIIKANKLNHFHSPNFHLSSTAEIKGDSLASKFKTVYQQKYTVPPRLEVVESRMSLLHFQIPPVSMSNNSLTTLDLSRNLICDWKGPLSLSHLKFLDLSLNYCWRVGSNFFQEMVNLETLLSGRNFLGESLELDENGDIFKPLSKLKTLDLHSNRIYTLPASVMKGLLSLEVLNVSDNELKEWNVDISHMVNLSVLDFHSNYLETLSEGLRGNLTLIAENKNLTVNLLDNDLECNCGNLEFFEWFVESKINFIYKTNYSCIDETKKRIPVENATELIYWLRKKCSSYTILISICSMTLGLFFILFIAGIVHRYRWKLRYIYYMTWGRYSLIKELQNSGKHYTFDAFVSYAAENESFIKGSMIPNLEERLGLKLCIHDRDFIPGREIAANIVNAIENSRKIIFIMSPAFIDSYWCMFEFNMTRMEKNYLRGSEEVMFIIMLENLYSCRLPIEVLDLIQSQSYIEYPNDIQGDVVFWEKVKQAIES